MNSPAAKPSVPVIKTPPFLLGATLLFWGWQSDFFAAGVVMALVLEAAQFVKVRWPLPDEDVSRIWTFCTLLALAALIFAFAQNDGPANFGRLLQDTGAADRQDAGNSSARTATALLRWLPMVMFLFVATLTYSIRETFSLQAISFILRRRRDQARKSGLEMPRGRNVNVTYPYFILCLFSASVHPNQGSQSFFAGECVLIAWALWPLRSRRYRWTIWAGLLAIMIGIGFLGQQGLSQLERIAQNYQGQWLERFVRMRSDPSQSVTSLGRVGRLKLSGKIVIRLQPAAGTAPPTYLREASYRLYHSQIWRAGPVRDDFTSVNSERDGTTWQLLPAKTNTASVNIASYLAGGSALLPLPAGSGRLENLRAFLLQKNATGAVLANGPGLVIFDARYGAGTTIDAPPDPAPGITNLDLFVPTNEIPALETVIAEMKLPDRDLAHTLGAVSGFFSAKFQYSTWLGADKLARTNETVLSRFLLQSRSGHCEYFATATVLLLRELGIPARYAVGYAVHETSGRGYVVRERDGHAWCLVWDRSSGTWQDFDTTPSSWVAAEESRASVFQKLSDAWSWVGYQIAKFRWSQTSLRQYLLWALIPVLALLLLQIIFRRGKRPALHRIDAAAVALPRWLGLDSEFYQLESKLAARGVARQPDEPLAHWLTRALADAALADLKTPLLALLQLHYRHRFDPRGLTPAERETLKRETQTCLAALNRPTPF